MFASGSQGWYQGREEYLGCWGGLHVLPGVMCRRGSASTKLDVFSLTVLWLEVCTGTATTQFNAMAQVRASNCCHATQLEHTHLPASAGSRGMYWQSTAGMCFMRQACFMPACIASMHRVSIIIAVSDAWADVGAMLVIGALLACLQLLTKARANTLTREDILALDWPKQMPEGLTEWAAVRRPASTT